MRGNADVGWLAWVAAGAGGRACRAGPGDQAAGATGGFGRAGGEFVTTNELAETIWDGICFRQARACKPDDPTTSPPTLSYLPHSGSVFPQLKEDSRGGGGIGRCGSFANSDQPR